jgi:phosphatidylethanolamine/phosphatidyl-N-methylethanolamine N-methyltransferase
VKPEQLLLVEANPTFVSHLTRNFPGVRVVGDDAAALPRILQAHGQAQVSHIISGLPFRSLKLEQRQQITAAIGNVLRPGGVLVQFTYALRPPLAEDDARKAGLVGARKALIASNLPPAFVWRYEKLA